MRSCFLRTYRICFSEWNVHDIDLAETLWGDPEVTKLICASGVFTKKDIEKRLDIEIHNNNRYGVQYWPIFTTETNDLIGCCGLRPYKENEYEIGFHLRPKYWGQGYATEAAEAMLAIGKEENEKSEILNADYVIGTAENIPFEDNTFDIVVSRLAFHHFTDAETVFSEMCRVLKPNGQIVIADMLAREEPFRIAADKYETLRDPSHVRCLSLDELTNLSQKYSMSAVYSSITVIPVKLNAWMELTSVPNDIRESITSAMTDEMNGKSKTGFEPYLKSGEIMFNHKWLLFITKK